MAAQYVERIDYRTFDDALDVYLHQQRYTLAAQAITGKRILDVGCGYGFGTHAMATQHPDKQFVWIDIDPAAISYAQEHNAAPNITYLVMSATALTYPDASFDTVTSIENIEHIPDDQTYIAELARVLIPAWTLLLTTPNDNRRSHQLKRLCWRPVVYSHFHIREYNLDQLRHLVTTVWFRIMHQQGLYLNLIPRRAWKPLRRLSQQPLVYKFLVHFAPLSICSYFFLTLKKEPLLV